jgi:hypothetical protein
MREMKLGPVDGAAFNEIGVVGGRVHKGLIVGDCEGLAVFGESESG